MEGVDGGGGWREGGSRHMYIVRWLRVIMQVYQFPLDKSIKFCMVVP